MTEARLVTDRERLGPGSRYELLVRLASGGMATVYVGELRGVVGFRRVVAIKRAHAHLYEDAAFREMFVAEAQLSSRLHHPNVAAVKDVEDADGELLLIMDYVDGVALSDLLEACDGPAFDIPVALRVLVDACAGLEAAHRLTDEDGRPLGLVHRDVSPHNLLLGADGGTFLVDFGIAKAMRSAPQTETGSLRGKLAYMAPEYLRGERATQRTDVFSMGVVMWETLTGKRLFARANEPATMEAVSSEAPPPRVETIVPSIDEELSAIVARALDKRPEHRYASAGELRAALEAHAKRKSALASTSEVAAAVRKLAGREIDERRALLKRAMDAALGRSTGVERSEAGAGIEDPSTDTKTLEVLGKPAETAPGATLSKRPPPAGEQQPEKGRRVLWLFGGAAVAGAIAAVALVATRGGDGEASGTAANNVTTMTSTSATAATLASSAAPTSTTSGTNTGTGREEISARVETSSPMKTLPPKRPSAQPKGTEPQTPPQKPAADKPTSDKPWVPGCNPYTDPTCSKP